MTKGASVKRATDRVYEAVRDEIVRGRYQPGSHLGEALIAAQYGVSRTPVRAALARLHSDGFVTMTPHLGAVVITRSLAEVGEIFEVRAILESAAAGLAASRRSGQQLDTLAGIADAMDREHGEGADVSRLSALNLSFHATILAASGNPILVQSAERLMALGFLTHTYAKFAPPDVARSLADHRNLLAALESRDEAWAAALMRAHVLGASHTLRSRGAPRRPATTEPRLGATAKAAVPAQAADP